MGLTRILFEKHTDKGWTIAALNSFGKSITVFIPLRVLFEFSHLNDFSHGTNVY